MKHQSAKDPLYIAGSGFKGEPELDFYSAISSPENYTVTVESESWLKLELVKGSMWSKSPSESKRVSELVVKGINFGDGYVRREDLSVVPFFAVVLVDCPVLCWSLLGPLRW